MKKKIKERKFKSLGGGRPRSVDYEKIVKKYNPNVSLRKNAERLGVSHTLISRALAYVGNLTAISK